MLALAIDMSIYMDVDLGFRIEFVEKLVIPCVWIQILGFFHDTAGKELRFKSIRCKLNFGKDNRHITYLPS